MKEMQMYWFKDENIVDDNGNVKIIYCDSYDDVLTAHGVEFVDEPAIEVTRTQNTALLSTIFELVNKAKGDLTPIQRAVVLLHKMIDGGKAYYSSQEMAAMIDIKSNTLGTALKPLRVTAQKNLGRQLKDFLVRTLNYENTGQNVWAFTPDAPKLLKEAVLESTK
jgi:hypothetical protein